MKRNKKSCLKSGLVLGCGLVMLAAPALASQQTVVDRFQAAGGDTAISSILLEMPLVARGGGGNGGGGNGGSGGGGAGNGGNGSGGGYGDGTGDHPQDGTGNGPGTGDCLQTGALTVERGFLIAGRGGGGGRGRGGVSSSTSQQSVRYTNQAASGPQDGSGAMNGQTYRTRSRYDAQNGGTAGSGNGAGGGQNGGGYGVRDGSGSRPQPQDGTGYGRGASASQ